MGWIYEGDIYKIYDQSEKDSFTETLESLVSKYTKNDKTLLVRR